MLMRGRRSAPRHGGWRRVAGVLRSARRSGTWRHAWQSRRGDADGWLAASAGLLLLLGAAAGWSLIALRQDTLRGAATAGTNLAEALQEDIARTIAGDDLAMRFFAAGLTLPDNAAARQRDVAIAASGAAPPFLSALLVTDAAGHLRSSTLEPEGAEVDLSERDYFAVQREHPDRGLYVSQPFTSRKSGASMLALSRGLVAPDGGFAGIVAATLRQDYFTNLAQRFRLGPGAVLLLVRDDGTVLVRVPPAPTSLGARLSPTLLAHLQGERAGETQSISPVDGQRRLYSFAHVEGQRLAVLVGVTTAAIYADWVRRALIIGPILGVLTLLAGGLLLLLAALRQQRAQRRSAERAARRGDAIFRLIAEHSSDVVTCLDADDGILYVSPAVAELVGHPAEALVGRPFLDAIHPDDRDAVRRLLGELRATGERATLAYRCPHRDGREVWVETSFRQLRNPDTGLAEEIIASTRDVTRHKLAADALNSTARELAVLAATDSLTGLGNRRRFDEVIAAEWLRARRDGSSLSLLMIDVDRFKSYNDTFGHRRGDEVLREVARVIRAHARRPADFPARYGGEEFALILPATEVEGAMLVAEDIRRGVAGLAIAHAGSPRGVVSVSIGVAASLGDAQGAAETLVEAADAALYQAKRSGRDRTEVFGAAAAALRGIDGPAGALPSIPPAAVPSDPFG
jgi:diguanylate cyclase (GGDEF)-like protein/PAS domain S-box-containing protein